LKERERERERERLEGENYLASGLEWQIAFCACEAFLMIRIAHR
jgi:hypothetical protein